MIIEDY